MTEFNSPRGLPSEESSGAAEDCPSHLEHIVGVGASAGGLEALERLFKSMPSTTGMAFVVVQHLSPDFKSHMEQLLGRHTSMAIHRVEDGMPIQPDCIYLIPPRKVMIVADGKLLLADKDPESGLSLPIDQFFRSLAGDIGRKAIGVILSGTGSDGSRGIEEIFKAGGLVLAQEPGSAAFDGMPIAAIDTGFVHVQAAPDAMPDLLERYCDEGILPESLAEEAVHVAHNGLEPILHQLQAAYRIDFANYKFSTVSRRVTRRMEFAGLATLDEYAALLEENPGELSELYKDLLIGVTRFRRDEDAFVALERTVLPELIRQKKPGDSLRIWTPGCATGEEAYSLAMVIDELVSELSFDLPVKIFATDVHRDSLKVATRGVYQEKDLTSFSKERRQRYFREELGEFQIAADLRKMVVFAEHNLLSQPPFTQQDLVVCRNLLIYFQPTAQRRVLLLFHFALRTGGVLMLGPSETVGELEDEFKVLEKRWRIFKKRRDVRLPLEQRLAASTSISSVIPAKGARPTRGLNERLRQTCDLYGEILDEDMPPSAVISANFEIEHMFGGFSRLLAVTGRRVSTNLLELLPSDLKTTISGAVTHAGRESAAVRYSGVSVDLGEGNETITLVVRPMELTSAPTQLFLLKLERSSSWDPSSNGLDSIAIERRVDINQATLTHIRSLEKDLSYARENLQATVEELETSNEELQATNEELVAGNEELQSTNEELQSVNEELFTVNAEHQRKIEELTRANNDMDNLLKTTDVGVFFLDAELKIRRFTPELSSTLGLGPNDIGMSVDRIAYPLGIERMAEQIEEGIDQSERFECEVRSPQHGSMLLRVFPYRSAEETGEFVGTLIDVSQVRRAESLLERFKFICDRSPYLLSMLDDAGRFIYVNEAFCQSIGRDEAECLQLTVGHIDPDWNVDRYRALFREVHAKGSASFESRNLHNDGSIHPVEVTVAPFVFEGNKVLFSQSRDITERRAAEQRLAFQHQISLVAAQAENLSRAASDFLGPFIDLLGMEAAEFWRFEPLAAEADATTGQAMRQSIRLQSGLDRADVWAAASNNLTIQRGVGLLGKAWESKRVQWTDDLPNSDGFDRREVADQIHFQIGCAFPVLDNETVIGVIAFYSATRYVDPSALVESLMPLARMIGQTFRRLETERALKLRDRAVDATHDGIVIADARLNDHPLVYANSGFAALTGYSADEVIGRNCRFLQGEDTDPEVVSRIKSAVDRCESTREIVLNYRKDGEPFWNELHISPVHGDDGETTHFVAVQHDISERKKTEEDLESAKFAAMLANDAKSRFLANMSHEIRTPMAAILGFADALRPEVTTPKAKAHLGVIKRNGSYLLQLINDILDLSKVEAGQLSVELSATDLPSLLKDVRDLMDVRAEETGADLEFCARGKLPALIQTDSTRLRQILVNLVSNAIKFAANGRVTVTASVVSEGSQSELHLAVQDNGIGIAPEQQVSIFEPFTQVRTQADAVRSENSGTGLGLAITRRLVQALGGRLALESQLGEGSVFTVTLPTGSLENTTFVDWSPAAVVADLDVDERSLKVTERSLRGVRVLVADDRVDVGRAVAFYLEDAGAEVVHVANGRLAVDEAMDAEGGDNPFALILMDMQMPVLDGFGATRELRERGYSGKVIAVTAAAMSEDVDRCLEAGCDHFLAKPVEEDLLLSTASRLIAELPAVDQDLDAHPRSKE